jgi:hypothetical protein
MKVKQSPQHAYEGAEGKRIYSSYSFTTSALDGVNCQRHSQGKVSRYPLYRGWVGPRVGPDTEAGKATGTISCLFQGSNLDRLVFQSIDIHYTD